MKLSTIFLEDLKAQLKKPKIGITILRPIPETIDSLKRASQYAELTVIGAKIDGFTNIVEEDPDKASVILIDLLKTGQVDGIVRGQVKDSFTLDEFHRQFGKAPLPSNRKIAPGILEKGEYSFVVSTCSIYQGITLEDKIYEVERLIKYMKEDLKVEPNIGIMSSLRPTSHVGQYPLLDGIAEINQKLTAHLKNKGYAVKEYYFEYETAVWSGANLIVPSMGLVGNAWLKALLYLGDWDLVACPYLDLGVAYEDGTRNEKDFFNHIMHCTAMINGKNKF
jgi:predicted methyltransferase MtxX (methanogen marker protein 4)